MYKTLWENLHKAVCSIGFYTDSGIKLSSVTGFKVGNTILTDRIVFKIQSCAEVVFQFMNEDGYTVQRMIRMNFGDFSDRLNRITEFESEGFAMIDFDRTETEHLGSLEVDLDRNYSIGDRVVLLGYHLDQENLCMKEGIISSFVKKAEGGRYIQFEISIKLGNSGSPLIHADTGKVIGVVGYKFSPLAKTYEAFKNIIDENLRILKKSKGMLNILDVDPVQILIANQIQLKQLGRDYYRSGAMSFGLACEVHNIYKYLIFNNNQLQAKIVDDSVHLPVE